MNEQTIDTLASYVEWANRQGLPTGRSSTLEAYCNETNTSGNENK